MIRNREGVLPLLAILFIVVIGFIILVSFFLKSLIIGVMILIAVFIIYGLSTGKLKTDPKKGGKLTIIVILIAIVLIFVAVGTGFILEIAPITIDTETKELPSRIDDVYGIGIGLWNGKLGDNCEIEQEGEIFDKEAYAVSWKPGVESETITMNGGICWIAFYPKHLDDFKMKLYWSDDGVNWGSPISEWSNAVFGEFTNQYAFFENKPNSAIRVELTADVWGGLFGDWKAADDNIYAYDQAYIYQGAGDIEILNENKIVEIGEDVLIDVKKLGYSAGRGWSLELFSYPQNKIVKTWDLGDGDVGVYRYLVTTMDWIAWSGCDDPQSDTPNRLEARLYNNLWKQDEADVDTIDLRARAPPQPEVSTDKGWYNVNNTIEMAIKGKRNPSTNLELCYFLLDVYYQPGLIQIHDDEKVAAVGDNATYESDPLPQSGTVRIEVTAYDAGGRPSNHTILQRSVKPTGQDCNPLTEDCGDESNLFGIPWLWIILIVIIIVAILLYFVFRKKKRGR
jgi:hypothetical protein